MDYRFENVQSYNEKMYLELQYRQRKNTFLLGVLCLGAALVEVFFALRGDTRNWVFAAVLFVGTVHYLLLPYVTEKKRAKAYFASYDGDSSPARIRFGEQVMIEDHSAVMTMDYDQIQQVIALRHGLFLRWNDNAYLAIDPNTFTKGTFSEFKAFLREKRPDLNIPD